MNFALEARYAARFLEKNNLAFTTVEPNAHGDAHSANQAALGAVVIALTLALAWCRSVAATEAQQDAVLPALRFAADALGSEFYEQIQRAPQFQKMNREALGSPIELRIYHTYRLNRGSAATTGLLAAATLGLLPEVSSGEHAIVYEVLVNGVLLSSHKYGKALTHAHNVWTKDTTHGMGKEGMEWAKSTVDLFLKDAAADPKLSALAAEFDYYFGPAKL